MSNLLIHAGDSTLANGENSAGPTTEYPGAFSPDMVSATFTVAILGAGVSQTIARITMLNSGTGVNAQAFGAKGFDDLPP